MGLIYVILLFVLTCTVLVHINLHQKKNELYNLLVTATKTIITRHKKIKKILKYTEETDLTKEIEVLNNETIAKIENNELSPSKMVKAEILIEDKMKTLLEILNSQEISAQLKEAIESYEITQKKVKKNKKKYNKIIDDFIEACNLKPANFYTFIEKIDTDFDKVDEDN